jgi:hypothetical protein
MLATARVALASIVALILLSPSMRARADGPFEGDWRQGPMQIDVRVETWGPDCGPRPQSSTAPARGTVHVTQDGDHLSFGGRRSTRSCWSENRAVRLVSSRVQSGSWQILCRTPTDDPRRETATTTLRAAGGDRIELRDETAYDWTLNESHCTARVTTTQTFERIGRAMTPEPTPEPRPEPTPEPRPTPTPCTAGAAARVVVRPADAQVEPGERVCFQARVVDASGCALRDQSAELSLGGGSVGALRGSCFEATSAGNATIVARAGALEGRASVRVQTLDLSGLVARRAEGGGLDDEGDALAEEEAGVAARAASAGGGPSPWLVAVAVVAGSLAILAAILLVIRARRRQGELEERARRRAEAVVVTPPPPVVAEGNVATGPGQPMICPLCRRGYGTDVTLCPKDHERLVPYAEFVARREQSTPERVCPTCGTRYPGTTKFCVKDGTTLGA